MILKQWTIANSSTTLDMFGAQLTGNFTVYNPGPDETYDLLGLALIPDRAWHGCRSPVFPKPEALESFSCKLDRVNNEIHFQLQWLCSDLNPAEP